MKKLTFMQEYLAIDMDDNIHYMVIIELENYLPVRSFIVKMPHPNLKFPSNPYLFN